MKDNRIRAHENEIGILSLLHRYGHVRQADIARAIWPTSSRGSAVNSASRTLGRLLRAKQIYRRMNTLGGFSYMLAGPGANRIGTVLGEDARSGRGLTSVDGSQFLHRTLESRYLIEKEIEGFTGYGEYAIYRGVGGFSRDLFAKKFKKIPDGLILVKGATRGYDQEITLVDWLEVEGHYKPPQEREKILDVATKSGTWLDMKRKVMLHRVVFVYLAVNGHQRSLREGIDNFIRAHDIKDPFFFDSIVLAECDVLPPFSWRGYTEKTWLDVLKSRGLDEAGKPISE